MFVHKNSLHARAEETACNANITAVSYQLNVSHLHFRAYFSVFYAPMAALCFTLSVLLS